MHKHNALIFDRSDAAQDLGLPFLNPYLGKNKSFDHGVNFAVAGATAMDHADQYNLTAGVPVASNSLKVQLRWFKDFLKYTFGTDQGKQSNHFLHSSSINNHRPQLPPSVDRSMHALQ